MSEEGRIVAMNAWEAVEAMGQGKIVSRTDKDMPDDKPFYLRLLRRKWRFQLGRDGENGGIEWMAGGYLFQPTDFYCCDYEVVK